MADNAIAMLVVLVDNEGSAENVARAGRQLGCAVSLEQEAGFFALRLSRTPESPPPCLGTEPFVPACGPGSDVVVMIASNALGQGPEALGRLLMIAFLKTLSKVVPRPRTLVLLNSGVQLATSSSEVKGALQELEQQGVRIWSCGTCLDYYHLKDDLAVGTVSNMFDIASALVAADRVIAP
ncbi:MAG: sulfurtransferase-like selenium metabolism protein YedF [Myxococcota bacterium]|nr:sulfurtransferase-like selenium metabolism protein YedF [Myxococcota bacterium]